VWVLGQDFWGEEERKKTLVTRAIVPDVVGNHVLMNGCSSHLLQESSKLENPGVCGQEHVMARLLAYKHLPPSLELPSINTGGSQRPSSGGNCRKGHSSSNQSKETNI